MSVSLIANLHRINVSNAAGLSSPASIDFLMSLKLTLRKIFENGFVIGLPLNGFGKF